MTTSSPFEHDPNDHHDEIGDPQFTDHETGHIFQNAQDLIIWELLQGNRKYVKWMSNRKAESASVPRSQSIEASHLSAAQLKQIGYLQQIEEERLGVGGGPLRPVRPKALTISCARSFSPMDHVFGADARSLMSVRVSGYTCSGADSVIGSVEFALAEKGPPVLMVVGNARNDIVATSLLKVLRSMENPPCKLPSSDIDDELMGKLDHSNLMTLCEPAVMDALQHLPGGTYDQLVDLACRMNVWRTIETLLTNSQNICLAAKDGSLRVIGAFFDAVTGAVQIMGQHPSHDELIKEVPSGDIVRTADMSAVPAEEAATMLYSGNKRYSAGKGGFNQLNGDDRLLKQLSEGGQNPVSVVIGCADSRAPIEILFDMRPGDLFVLRNAGNTCASNKGSLVGSAEYSISHLRTKLLVIAGHTQCGAVTAAIQAARSGADLSSMPGSIGLLLADIIAAAQKAVAEMPDADIKSQVKLATKYNVFNTIKKLIASSDIVYTGVKVEELQLIGAVYDIYSGDIEWLGEHPDLEVLCGREMPMHRWKVTPYSTVQSWDNNAGRSKATQTIIKDLVEGNDRFVTGQWNFKSPVGSDVPPSAIVLGGSEYRVPIEDLFDVEPGRLVVQRVLGSVAGMQERTAFASIEYALARWKPSLLLVLVESNSPIIEAAIRQLRGQYLPRAPIRVVLDHVMVSALRATQQTDQISSLSAAGRELRITQLATELNCLYSMELLLKSKVIRDMVLAGKVELHAAIMESGTGKVRFLGEHPKQLEIIQAADLRDMTFANGLSATLAREEWKTPFQPVEG